MGQGKANNYVHSLCRIQLCTRPDSRKSNEGKHTMIREVRGSPFDPELCCRVRMQTECQQRNSGSNGIPFNPILTPT
jgi:hypothetical protein